MADLNEEQKKLIAERRAALVPLYPEVEGIPDEEILSYTDETMAAMLNPPPDDQVTKEDIAALRGVIDQQNEIMRQVQSKNQEYEAAIGALSQNLQTMAEAVTPLVQAFHEFSGDQPPSKTAVAPSGNGGNGNGGGKLDIIGLLSNPAVQKLLGGGQEQVNPMEHFIGQVKQVTELLSTLDEIRGTPRRNNGITPGNIDMSTLLKGMQWGYRIKNGQLPPGLMQALGGDDNGDTPPNIIIMQQPAEAPKNRRDEGPGHSGHLI